MSRAITPSSPSASIPRQNKVMLQRQYREKEGECFNTLREVLNELTGAELQTRQEILRKAIDLLLAVSEIRKPRETKPIVHPASYEPCVLSASENAATLAHIGHSTDLSQWSQDWQSSGAFDAQFSYHLSHPYSQQHHSLFNTDITPTNQAGSRGFNDEFSHFF